MMKIIKKNDEITLPAKAVNKHIHYKDVLLFIKIILIKNNTKNKTKTNKIL